MPCCGLRGIAARIHLARSPHPVKYAVACGESPLGYTHAPLIPAVSTAVACGESPLGYTGNSAGEPFRRAVACGESPLGYTRLPRTRRRRQLWLAGNRRSDTLSKHSFLGDLLLWLAGNRRSDTLNSPRLCPTKWLWLAGNRRSDTLLGVVAMSRKKLWLAGNRRSDTLQSLRSELRLGCGLRGIAARIHSKGRAGDCRGAVACGESPLGYTPSGVNLYAGGP